MPRPVDLSHSRAFPIEPARAFEEVLSLPLSDLFHQRHLAVPAIREVRDQQGAWGTPGQHRTIVLADGGTMREELVEVDRPRRFSYRLDHVTGPMKPLATHIDGTWSFEPAGTGTRVTWAWTVHPQGRVGTAVMPAFAPMWRGYARKGFDAIERLLVG